LLSDSKDSNYDSNELISVFDSFNVCVIDSKNYSEVLNYSLDSPYYSSILLLFNSADSNSSSIFSTLADYFSIFYYISSAFFSIFSFLASARFFLVNSAILSYLTCSFKVSLTTGGSGGGGGGSTNYGTPGTPSSIPYPNSAEGGGSGAPGAPGSGLVVQIASQNLPSTVSLISLKGLLSAPGAPS